jgi:hypothetical protein
VTIVWLIGAGTCADVDHRPGVAESTDNALAKLGILASEAGIALTDGIIPVVRGSTR